VKASGEAHALLGALAFQRGEDRLDHLHRAAGVDFLAGEIGEVGQYRFMHQARAPAPVVFRRRFGKHRDEVEVLVFGIPAGRQVGQVKIGQPAHAPVQVYRTLEAAMEGVLDHALDRREAGGAGDENDRTLGFAQREIAQRAIETDLVAQLHALEHVRGEAPARHQANLQFDEIGLMRRIGEGEGAPLTVVEDDVDVLAGLERDFFSLRQLEHHPHHVVGEFLQVDHARLVLADRAGYRGRHVVDLDVAQGRGAAQQHLAGGALLLGQRAGLV
jgi:hypothetical protein